MSNGSEKWFSNVSLGICALLTLLIVFGTTACRRQPQSHLLGGLHVGDKFELVKKRLPKDHEFEKSCHPSGRESYAYKAHEKRYAATFIFESEVTKRTELSDDGLVGIVLQGNGVFGSSTGRLPKDLLDECEILKTHFTQLFGEPAHRLSSLDQYRMPETASCLNVCKWSTPERFGSIQVFVKQNDLLVRAVIGKPGIEYDFTGTRVEPVPNWPKRVVPVGERLYSEVASWSATTCVASQNIGRLQTFDVKKNAVDIIEDGSKTERIDLIRYEGRIDENIKLVGNVIRSEAELEGILAKSGYEIPAIDFRRNIVSLFVSSAPILDQVELSSLTFKSGKLDSVQIRSIVSYGPYDKKAISLALIPKLLAK